VDFLGEVLALALLSGLALLVPATVSVFIVGDRARPVTDLRAFVASGAVAALVMAGAMLAAGRPPAATTVAVLLGFSVLAWRKVGDAWATRGLLVWALAVDVGVAYLGYVLWWIATADLSVVGTAASLVLWLLELFVFVLALGYVWELVDVLARRRWSRTVDLDTLDPSVRAFVSLHVPAHNEPPDLVIATLEALLRLDYDDYEILVIDNNTEDESLWRPVEEFCSDKPRVRFFHLANWPGYKSGALNFALTETDPRAELVGVVDADYLVEPSFLARVAPMFADEKLGFVQTPQDYRDWDIAPYFRRLYHSYGYFFDVSQRSRNEVDGAIFGGTMGLILRTALDRVGGWDEWCITEDAELSLRLLREGFSGQHVHESFGRGIMPLTFEALKRQRFRWCFGGVQILRMHWRDLLPWTRTHDNRLSLAQRWSYLVSGLQWYGDLVGLLFTAFLLASALDLVSGEGVVVRRLQGVLLVCLVVLVVLGAARSLALLKHMRGTTWREALGAFGLWLGLGWAVALGAVRGTVAREGAFLRTPKTRGELGWRDTLRGNRTEIVMAVICLGLGCVVVAQGTLAGAAVGGLLLVQALGFAAAPVNSWAAINTDLTQELSRRRRTLLPSWTRMPGPRRLALWPVSGLAAVAIGSVVLAAPAGNPLGGDLPAQVRGEAPARDAGTKPSQRPTPRPTSGAPTTALTPSASATTSASGAGLTQTRTAATATKRPTAAPTAAPTPTATAPTQPGKSPTTKPTAAPTTNKPTSLPTHPTPTRRP